MRKISFSLAQDCSDCSTPVLCLSISPGEIWAFCPRCRWSCSAEETSEYEDGPFGTARSFRSDIRHKPMASANQKLTYGQRMSQNSRR